MPVAVTMEHGVHYRWASGQYGCTVCLREALAKQTGRQPSWSDDSSANRAGRPPVGQTQSIPRRV